MTAQNSIPSRIQARSIDKIVDIGSSLFVNQIQLLIEFAGRLDRKRLQRALRLLLDAEPVLGCAFVPRWIRPYWRRLSAEELERAQLLQVAAGDESALDDQVQDFLGERMNSRQGPQVRALLVNGGQGDRLIIKVNHQVGDAGGTKELGYMLASIYRRLESQPDYQPTPNFGTRSLRQVYDLFLPRHFFGILRRHLKDFKNVLVPFKSLQFVSGAERTGGPRFVFKRLGSERMGSLKAYCARTGATLNDLTVTATMRALARQANWKGESVLRLISTVDLRRYLPGERTEAVCNLSSVFIPSLGKTLEDDFDDTLVRVKEWIDDSKKNYFGLGFVLFFYLVMRPIPFVLDKWMGQSFFRMLIAKGHMMPAQTNMGVIDETALDFGSPSVTIAELAPPANIPPCRITGLSGYRDTLTISAGFFEPSVKAKEYEQLFDLIDEELPS